MKNLRKATQLLRDRTGTGTSHSLVPETTPPILTLGRTPVSALGEGPCHDPRLGKWSTLEVSSEPDAVVTNPMESGGVRVPFSEATPRYMFLWQDFPWTHLPLLLRESQLTVLWSPDPSSWLWC